MNSTNRRHQEFTVVTTGNRRRAGHRPRPAYASARTASGLSAVQLTTPEIGRFEPDLLARHAPAVLPKQVLLVDPNASSSAEAHNVLRLIANVHVCRDFTAARERLRKQPPDILIANVRLHEYNGLHLVHLAAAPTRCIVYSAHEDLVLAREVQAAGAFYERSMRLSRTLPGYVNGNLPAYDRRDVTSTDRRKFPRGGRRSSDW